MSTFLPTILLERIHERAPRHDAENTFPSDDLEELRAFGYLAAHVPEELGGAGLSLADLAREQSRLAAAAPATALAINMHQVWVAIAVILHRQGHGQWEWVLREAAAGRLFAFGFSEPGNNAVPLVSLTRVERTASAAVFTGTKVFTSLGPVWDHLGLFGTVAEDSAEEPPAIVYGFATRGAPGITSHDDWDALGMRATQSGTTSLEGTSVPEERILWTARTGEHDELTQALSAVFATLIAAVYIGLGQRALEIAGRAILAARPKVLDAGTREENPQVRALLTGAHLRLDAVLAQEELLTERIDAARPVDRPLATRTLGVKIAAVDAAREVVEHAQRIIGGGAYVRDSELARLHRDATAGLFHPADADAVERSIVAAVLDPLREA